MISPEATLDLSSSLKRKQAHRVSYRRAAASDARRYRVLRHVELVGQPSIGERFFDRIEVRALQVLDEREFEQLAAGCLAHNDRHALQPG